MQIQRLSACFYIYIFAIYILIVGMLFSNFLMSISQILLFANWIFESNWIEKASKIRKNYPLFIMVLFYLMIIIGLLYSDDKQWGLHDLKVKLPLLILPIVFATSPVLEKINLKKVLLFYISVVFSATIFSFYLKSANNALDVRGTSIFISHIRLSLHICMALFFMAYYVFKSNNKKGFLGVILIIWFLVFLIILESVTGLVISIIVILVLGSIAAIKIKNILIKGLMMCGIVLLPISLFICVKNIFVEYSIVPKVDISLLEKITSKGNPYTHDTINFLIENSKCPGIYLCSDEMKDAWNKRSHIRLETINYKNSTLYYTLVRFLTSKDYRKDADGVNKLSKEEIIAIQEGVANKNYLDVFNFKSRIYKIAYEFAEYKISGNVSNKSVVQRYELSKASVLLIKKNFVFGIGNGDIKNAFKNQLIEMKSDLQNKGLRAHNQFLTFFISFGVFGLLLFILYLIFPMLYLNKHKSYFYVIFILILCCSMFAEDTLETQAGVTLFAFFNSFLLFNQNKNERKRDFNKVL